MAEILFMSPDLVRINGYLLTERKSILIDLTKRNANHIIPSYFHPPVGYRGLVQRCGFTGACKP